MCWNLLRTAVFDTGKYLWSSKYWLFYRILLILLLTRWLSWPFLSLFMFLQFFVASCVHFDGRVMSPGIPKTPSESPSHRCIFPFGGALYAWCTTGLCRHRFIAWRFQRFQETVKLCRLYALIRKRTSNYSQNGSKSGKTATVQKPHLNIFELQLGWIRLVLWHFMMAWWHKEPSFARKRRRHEKDVSVEGFPGSHVRWNGQPRRLNPTETKAALPPLNVCIDVDEDQTAENGKEKVLGERSLSWEMCCTKLLWNWTGIDYAGCWLTSWLLLGMSLFSTVTKTRALPDRNRLATLPKQQTMRPFACHPMKRCRKAKKKQSD